METRVTIENEIQNLEILVAQLDTTIAEAMKKQQDILNGNNQLVVKIANLQLKLDFINAREASGATLSDKEKSLYEEMLKNQEINAQNFEKLSNENTALCNTILNLQQILARSRYDLLQKQLLLEQKIAKYNAINPAHANANNNAANYIPRSDTKIQQELNSMSVDKAQVFANFAKRTLEAANDIDVSTLLENARQHKAAYAFNKKQRSETIEEEKKLRGKQKSLERKNKIWQTLQEHQIQNNNPYTMSDSPNNAPEVKAALDLNKINFANSSTKALLFNTYATHPSKVHGAIRTAEDRVAAQSIANSSNDTYQEPTQPIEPTPKDNQNVDQVDNDPFNQLNLDDFAWDKSWDKYFDNEPKDDDANNNNNYIHGPHR